MNFLFSCFEEKSSLKKLKNLGGKDEKTKGHLCCGACGFSSRSNRIPIGQRDRNTRGV